MIAGLSLLLALVCFGLGIAQRTVWAPPESVTYRLQEVVDAPVLVLDGGLLNRANVRQTIEIRAEGPITAVVGRTHDIVGWIGDTARASAVLNDTENGYDVETTPGESAEVPSPIGNDMWSMEHSGEDRVQFTIDAPRDYSILILTDGQRPAPSDVSVTWPNSATYPLFGPLMVAGLGFLAIALLTLLLALRSHRKRRGPQRRTAVKPRRRDRSALNKAVKRGLPAAPQRPALEAGSGAATAADTEPSSEHDDEPSAAESSDTESSSAEPSTADGDEQPGKRSRSVLRRSLRFGAVLGVVGLAATGCSPQFWPSGEPAATTMNATPTPSTIEETLAAPAVTVRQFQRILADTRTVMGEADASLDENLAASRLTGAMLAARAANYTVRSADEAIGAVPGIPDGDVQLLLPQQTESWPRSVLAIVGWDDASKAQSALVFVQENARSNYRVAYQYTLESGVEFPTVASSSLGAASLPEDTPLLMTQPNRVTELYANLLKDGDQAEGAALFNPEHDTLRTDLGYDYKQGLAGQEDYALSNVSFSNAQDDPRPIVLVTNDGGAIVATSFTETQSLTPKEEGVTIEASSGVAALSGVDESSTGIRSTYQLQVLMYIPPSDAGAGTQIDILGFAQTLVAAEEV